MVLVLLENMEYFSRKEANQWLVYLHTQLKEIPSVNDENTVYSFLKSKDGISNSSNDYWTEYKAINGINSNICYENLDAIHDYQWPYIENIIFIDDFSGSGKSFLDEINKHLVLFHNKRVFLIAVSVMEAAQDKILAFCEKNEIDCTLLCGVKQAKAFERDLFIDNELEKERLIALSTRLSIPAYTHLGFVDPETGDASQSLVAFYNNTPNNTLGILRYDVSNGYFSIFPRNSDPKPIWQAIKNTKNRKVTNYLNAKIKGEKGE